MIYKKSGTYRRKNTLFENETEWQKTEQVQFHFSALLGTSPMLKQETKKKIYNWTSEIIPFICFNKQVDET